MDTLTDAPSRKRLALELAVGLALAYAGRVLIDHGMALATARFIELIGPGDTTPTENGAGEPIRIVVDGAGTAEIEEPE
jgi:hypothetical protein